MDITLRLPSPLDGDSDAILPHSCEAGEASLRHVTDSSLQAISEELHVCRLSEAPLQAPERPLRVGGLLFGSSSRVFIPLIVRRGARAVNVVFLVDTGAPVTCLRKDTWEALQPLAGLSGNLN